MLNLTCPRHLDRVQRKVWEALTTNGPLRATALAEQVGEPRSYVCDALAGMEARGFVEKRGKYKATGSTWAVAPPPSQPAPAAPALLEAARALLACDTAENWLTLREAVAKAEGR